MNKGGYQILDLNSIVFEDGLDYVIDGIFNKISETRKPILITNFALKGSNISKCEMCLLCLHLKQTKKNTKSIIGQRLIYPQVMV